MGVPFFWRFHAHRNQMPTPMARCLLCLSATLELSNVACRDVDESSAFFVENSGPVLHPQNGMKTLDDDAVDVFARRVGRGSRACSEAQKLSASRSSSCTRPDVVTSGLPAQRDDQADFRPLHPASSLENRNLGDPPRETAQDRAIRSRRPHRSHSRSQRSLSCE